MFDAPLTITTSAGHTLQLNSAKLSFDSPFNKALGKDPCDRWVCQDYPDPVWPASADVEVIGDLIEKGEGRRSHATITMGVTIDPTTIDGCRVSGPIHTRLACAATGASLGGHVLHTQVSEAIRTFIAEFPVSPGLARLAASAAALIAIKEKRAESAHAARHRIAAQLMHQLEAPVTCAKPAKKGKK